MEEKKVSTLFEEMKDDISSYFADTLELGKLEAFEKISLGSSMFLYFLIFSATAMIALLLILLTAGLLLGNLLGEPWYGFATVALVALLLLIILRFFKEPLKKRFTNNIVRFLMKKEDRDQKNSNR